jgi:hypothetical protein
VYNKHRGHLDRIGSGLKIGRKYCDLAGELLNYGRFATGLRVMGELGYFLVDRVLPAKFYAAGWGLLRPIRAALKGWLAD